MTKIETIALYILIILSYILLVLIVKYDNKPEEDNNEMTAIEVETEKEKPIVYLPLVNKTFIDEFVDTYSKADLEHFINYYETKMRKAEELKQLGKYFGYSETQELGEREYLRAKLGRDFYYSRYEEVLEQEAIEAEKQRWEIKRAEYPVATTVWLFLKEKGFNDYTAAGIIGNMMSECAGRNLNLNFNAISGDKKYYGLCQWGKHYPGVWNAGLAEQLDFLMSNIVYEFNTFGNKYAIGFNFESFMNLTDAKEAAIAFAKCYERCNSRYVAQRGEDAIKAYNYFTN